MDVKEIKLSNEEKDVMREIWDSVSLRAPHALTKLPHNIGSEKAPIGDRLEIRGLLKRGSADIGSYQLTELGKEYCISYFFE